MKNDNIVPLSPHDFTKKERLKMRKDNVKCLLQTSFFFFFLNSFIYSDIK